LLQDASNDIALKVKKLVTNVEKDCKFIANDAYMILSPWYTYDERKHGYIYYLRVDNICYHGDDSIRSQELVAWNYPSSTFSLHIYFQ